MSDLLRIGDRQFSSRLFVGTGKYRTFQEMARCHAASGAEVVTVVIAMFFLIGGLFQLIGSLAISLPGWGWQAADGIITFILGLLVLAQWPASGLWVIGLFFGIDLIFFGLTWIALALGLRTA